MNPSPQPRLFGLPLPAAWAPALEKAHAGWARMAARERLVVQLGALLLGLLLLVGVGLRPAWKTLNEAPARLAQLDAQLAQMQRAAAEAKRLRQLPPVNPAQAKAALEAATAFLGPDAKLVIQGDRATLSFSNLPGESLGAWLAEVRSAARAKPVEAQLQRAAQGYGGRITLSLSAGGQAG